ncbi:MAG: hypothetical protein KAJ22_05365, partial [Candidatus Izimaplasma sp.]|nr:hypothetical protein [Candidatus Izimaplasma bacterium]
MKKLLFIVLLVFLSSFYYQSILASDYQTYQEITFEHTGGTLLEDYSDGDYEKYYKRIKKRRFWGWKTN